MRTLRLDLEYDGTPYAGWQRQLGAPTIQETLEQALLRLFGARVIARAASRTDAGVHARGQVVAFESDRDQIPLHGIRRALNSFLPTSISVRSVSDVPAGWHPRHAARGKRYCYVFWNRAERSALEHLRAWHLPFALDLDAMRAAAAHLIGEHDFEAFRSAQCDAEHARRHVHQIELASAGARVELSVVGNAFCRNMVRIIAGNLAEVGGRRRTPDSVRELLLSRDRTRGGRTAPPHGLYLEEVIYDDRLPPRPPEVLDA